MDKPPDAAEQVALSYAQMLERVPELSRDFFETERVRHAETTKQDAIRERIAKMQAEAGTRRDWMIIALMVGFLALTAYAIFERQSHATYGLMVLSFSTGFAAGRLRSGQ